MKHFTIQHTPPCLEKTVGELIVSLFVKGRKIHHVSALIEWPFGGSEHLGHKVLPAPREDEMDVVRELNVGSEHRFGTGFGILIDLLELVNSNENFVLNLVEIGENAPNGHFRLRRIHI